MHVIALETAELDRNSLAQITLATGGLLLSASKADELPKRFRQAAEALQHPFYRIAFTEVSDKPWEIVIGATNPVSVNHRIEESKTTSTLQGKEVTTPRDPCPLPRQCSSPSARGGDTPDAP